MFDRSIGMMIKNILELFDAQKNQSTLKLSGDTRHEFFTNLIDYEMVPIIYPFLSYIENITTDEIATLKKIYLKASIQNEYIIEVLNDISPELNEFCKPVFMQGMSLSQFLYTKPLIRPMNDIDLYLPDVDIEKLVPSLNTLGFTQYQNYQNVWNYKGIHFDFHSDLWGSERISQRKNCIPNHSPLFKKSYIDGYFYLDEVTTTLQTCFHGVKHAFIKPVWLLDILLLQKSNFIPMDKNVDLKNWGEFALSIVNELCGFRTEISPLTKKQIIAKNIIKKRIFGSGDIALSLMTNSWIETFAYLSEAAFPKKQILMSMQNNKHNRLSQVNRMFHLLSEVSKKL